MEIKSHLDLTVWQRSLDLVDEIYRVSRKFPKDERFGITSQMRRCSVSVPCNIAEGRGRGTRKDFASFISIAKGSLMELETLLEIAARQGYVSREEATPLVSEIHQLERMLSVLRSKLIGVTHGVELGAP